MLKRFRVEVWLGLLGHAGLEEAIMDLKPSASPTLSKKTDLSLSLSNIRPLRCVRSKGKWTNQTLLMVLGEEGRKVISATEGHGR